MFIVFVSNQLCSRNYCKALNTDTHIGNGPELIKAKYHQRRMRYFYSTSGEIQVICTCNKLKDKDLGSCGYSQLDTNKTNIKNHKTLKSDNWGLHHTRTLKWSTKPNWYVHVSFTEGHYCPHP